MQVVISFILSCYLGQAYELQQQKATYIKAKRLSGGTYGLEKRHI